MVLRGAFPRGWSGLRNPEFRGNLRCPAPELSSGRDGVQLFDVVGSKLPFARDDVLSYLFRRTRPGDDGTDLRVGQQPRDRQFEG